LSLTVVVTIGLLGGIGGMARFMLDDAVTNRLGREFPYGTLAVNLLGAFVLGLLVGAAIGHDAYRLAGIGLIGAFTTFSTWAFESHRLGEEGELRFGVMNFALSLVLGVTAAWVGRHVGGWL